MARESALSIPPTGRQTAALFGSLRCAVAPVTSNARAHKARSMTQLSPQQAYLAMFAFLEEEYRLCPSDEVGGLLGGMSLLPDGSPADSALANQWQRAIEAACSGQVSAALALGNEAPRK